MDLPAFLRRKKPGPRVAVVRLQGVIAAQGRGATLNSAGIGPILARAFKAKKPAAVALIVNSPGGSPVQSALIGRHIRRLAEETKTPVHAFVEDVAASGGYWLAAAADDIHVDDSSVTGSIGVISAGFGFTGALEKLGVERRVHTAGKDKSLLDPFRPERDEDIDRLKQIQSRVHDAFIAHVKARRGERLDLTNEDLFTGAVFVGMEAVEAGLADGVGHATDVLKAKYGEDVRFVAYAPRRPFLRRLAPGILDAALGAVEERTHWARYGL
ncbi:S49 family peptidase [Jannaschia sp. Os4]|uniref:S49 family peptidase n=1 Tax=Jannaschia sp. Os4 TaxID=2807617 RepID=UPI00193A9867|nr:S49 family peptidase [Jannaschia sp. Os4]MBM2576153.1 S49 family peptidase [Jannaschia sp. Os4]